MSETAKETLKNFSDQKMQLQKFIDQMTDWVTEVEESLLNCAYKQGPESLKKVKVSVKAGLHLVSSVFHFSIVSPDQSK